MESELITVGRRAISKARLVLRPTWSDREVIQLLLPLETTEEEERWYREFALHIRERLGEIDLVVRGRFEQPGKIRLQSNAKEYVATFEVLDEGNASSRE